MVIRLLFILHIICSTVWSQPVDPVIVGEVKADFNQPRSILKVEAALIIPDPWYIYSDSVSYPGLTPAALKLKDTASGILVKAHYPQPDIKHILGKDVSVFQGDVKLTGYFYLDTAKSFPVELLINYQPCSNLLCLKPNTRSISVTWGRGEGVRALVAPAE